jgi:iron complex outermembrane receptor protein
VSWSRTGFWLLLAFGSASLVARAQDGAPGDVDPQIQPPPGIEQIMVTARRRPEDLQVAPLALSALEASALREAMPTRLDDLAHLVPNLQLAPDDTGAALRVQVRGVGISDWINTRDPSVGLYVDGAYVPRAQGALLDVTDVERVEVLRGPQGTLYGRNAIGGAINVISRKPDTEREGEVSLRTGSSGLFETRSVLNAPLLDERLASRFSFTTRRRDGYTHNDRTGRSTDDDFFAGGRGSVSWRPGETLELNTTGDFARESRAGRGGQCRYSASAPAATGAVNDPYGVGAPQPIATLVPFMDMATGFVGRCVSSRASGDLDYRSEFASDIDVDVQGLSQTILWQPGMDLELKSISSWRRIEVARDQEFDYTESAFGRLQAAGDQQDAWSQELSLAGSALDQRVDWNAGLYAFFEKVNPGKELSLIGTGLGTLAFSYAAVNATENQDLSAFAQGTWHATEQLSVTAGIRRLTERKGWKHRRHALVGTTSDPQVGPIQANPGPDTALGTADDIPIDFDVAERFQAWTGLVNLAYQLHDDLLVYGQWASGYKSGGFNGRTNPSDLTTLESFDPEKLDSFELGVKSTWLDQSLRLNAALFHAIHHDLQQTLFKSADDGSFASVVRNASKAVVRGAEVELAAQLAGGFDVGMALGITDARYLDNDRQSRYIGPGPNGVFGDGDDAPRILDRDGEDFYNTPTYTAALSAGYSFPSSLGLWSTRLAWYAQSSVNFAPSEDIQGSTFGRQGEYGLLDARIGLKLPDGRTELALWGRNLLDRRYLNGALDFTDGFAVTAVYFGAPRSFGLELRRSFGY